MIAVKVKGFDLKEGQEFKFFFIVDPDSGDFRQLASERVNITDVDPDINSLRFKTGMKDIYGIVGSLLEATEDGLLAVLDDTNPRTGHIDITQTSHIAVFHSLGIEFDGGHRGRTDDALGQ